MPQPLVQQVGERFLARYSYAPHPELPLFRLRSARKYSREILAKNAGVSSMTIYRLETQPRNYRHVSMDTLFRLAQALDTTILQICPWLGHFPSLPPETDGPKHHNALREYEGPTPADPHSPPNLGQSVASSDAP